MSRWPALVGALVASLAAGCHHRTAAVYYESQHPTGPRCLVSKGCPPTAPIAACAADVTPVPLDELLARRVLQQVRRGAHARRRRGAARS